MMPFVHIFEWLLILRDTEKCCGDMIFGEAEDARMSTGKDEEPQSSWLENEHCNIPELLQDELDSRKDA